MRGKHGSQVFIFFLWLAAGLFPSNGQSADPFAILPEIEYSYTLILDLQLDSAQKVLKRVTEQHPDNRLVPYLENHIDFFRIFILEERATFEQLEANRNDRLHFIRSASEDSPYSLFIQAEIYLHWAAIHFKFGEYFTAAYEINKAFRLLKKNARQFPDFRLNYRGLGVLRAGVGTLPGKYRWIVKLLSSLEGTIEEGMANLGIARAHSHAGLFTGKTTIYIQALTIFHFQNDPEKAWSFLTQYPLNPETSPLDCYLLAKFAMATGRTDTAIRYLDARPDSASALPFHFLTFLKGVAKLSRIDADAHVYLGQYVDQFEGMNYIKEAYQKLAWHSLVHGDEDAYPAYMKKVMAYGSASTDPDKQALKEATTAYVPHPGILKARLLFDGGYYRQALGQLQSIDLSGMTRIRDRIEYEYRLGRVYHALEQYARALEQYQITVTAGAAMPEYFACNAALQSGEIYSVLGKPDEARTAYQICLDLNPDEYRDSLHQKARAGLEKLNTRSE